MVKRLKFAQSEFPAKPDTLPVELSTKSIDDLEALLLEAEQRVLDAEKQADDEHGLQLFLRYLGGAFFGIAMTLRLSGEEDKTARLGEGEGDLFQLALTVLAFALLISGYMMQRFKDRDLAVKSREYDRNRVLRALEQAMEREDKEPTEHSQKSCNLLARIKHQRTQQRK